MTKRPFASRSALIWQRSGFRVTEAPNAAEARKVLAGHAIELVILDIMMPGEDGLSLCRSIREQGDLPVILSPPDRKRHDRIVGLEMGADDYVLKPFSPRELVARIKTIMRRAGGSGAREVANEATVYRFEGWTLQSRRLDADRFRWRGHTALDRGLPPASGLCDASAPGAEPRPVARPHGRPRGTRLRPLDR